MNDLNLNKQHTEYFRVMEKRIRYYSEKYDPHTIINQHDVISEVEIPQERGRIKGISLIRSIFLNIF